MLRPCFVLIPSEVLFIQVILQKCFVFPQAPNSSESPGTSRTEHSDLLEEEEDERSDIKVKLKILLWKNTQNSKYALFSSTIPITELSKIFMMYHRTPPMATTMSVAMKTAISAAVDSLNMCPTHDQSTHHRSCPRPALCMVSMAPNHVSTTSPIDMQPPQWPNPHMNSSKLLSSSQHSQSTFIPLTPSTVVLLTCLLPTAAPSPAMLSLPLMRRWMRMTNRTRPARCPAHPASLMPPHKCPLSSLTMAGPHSACRLMSDWTKFLEKRRIREQWVDNHCHLHIHVWLD